MDAQETYRNLNGVIEGLVLMSISEIIFPLHAKHTFTSLKMHE